MQVVYSPGCLMIRDALRGTGISWGLLLLSDTRDCFSYLITIALVNFQKIYKSWICFGIEWHMLLKKSLFDFIHSIFVLLLRTR